MLNVELKKSKYLYHGPSQEFFKGRLVRNFLQKWKGLYDFNDFGQNSLILSPTGAFSYNANKKEDNAISEIFRH